METTGRMNADDLANAMVRQFALHEGRHKGLPPTRLTLPWKDRCELEKLKGTPDGRVLWRWVNRIFRGVEISVIHTEDSFSLS